MKNDNPPFVGWRRKSLTELEAADWGPAAFDSYLVTTCHHLRNKPIGEFTVEDLRIMIGQNIGLKYLVPIALEVLAAEPLAEGDYYPGDLLCVVLRAERQFYADNLGFRSQVESAIRNAWTELNKLDPLDRETTEEALREAERQFLGSSAQEETTDG